jgi:vacuolar-type H+-ATPase subunit H|tara:strand:+ start:403 stop:777 length:375 start_codon:yes stop_codon:yes gene_type:complete
VPLFIYRAFVLVKRRILDMSRNDLLVKIKRAETAAEQSVEDAEKEHTLALREGDKESLSIIVDARKKAESKASKDLDKAKKDISKNKDKVLKDGMVSIEKMQAESQEKSSNSAEAFVKKFLESM